MGEPCYYWLMFVQEPHSWPSEGQVLVADHILQQYPSPAENNNYSSYLFIESVEKQRTYWEDKNKYILYKVEAFILKTTIYPFAIPLIYLSPS